MLLARGMIVLAYLTFTLPVASFMATGNVAVGVAALLTIAIAAVLLPKAIRDWKAVG